MVTLRVRVPVSSQPLANPPQADQLPVCVVPQLLPLVEREQLCDSVAVEVVHVPLELQL